MKPFKSFMASQLEEYTLYRSSIGFTNSNLKSQLHNFDRYIREKEADWDTFTPAFFLKLRKQLKGDPRTVNGILSAIRGFFQYLLRKGIYEENPLQDIPPHAENAYIPFVFSPHEIEQMLRSIQKRLRKTSELFLKDLSIYVATLLLARCGMRISPNTRSHNGNK
jgi:site-specific recombinase XerD